MSAHLERLVMEWRDAAKAWLALCELGDRADTAALQAAMDRQVEASAALLKYADEEMG